MAESAALWGQSGLAVLSAYLKQGNETALREAAAAALDAILRLHKIQAVKEVLAKGMRIRGLLDKYGEVPAIAVLNYRPCFQCYTGSSSAASTLQTPPHVIHGVVKAWVCSGGKGCPTGELYDHAMWAASSCGSQKGHQLPPHSCAVCHDYYVMYTKFGRFHGVRITDSNQEYGTEHWATG